MTKALGSILGPPLIAITPYISLMSSLLPFTTIGRNSGVFGNRGRALTQADLLYLLNPHYCPQKRTQYNAMKPLLALPENQDVLLLISKRN